MLCVVHFPVVFFWIDIVFCCFVFVFDLVCKDNENRKWKINKKIKTEKKKSRTPNTWNTTIDINWKDKN